ncbi:MAG TPA: heavy metal translocating P-type ATPase [Candidatus Megamonas gallistercoris]|nr:heavy metal translocating P-type ATPase [Candidatus Megamonas gallistercoris]
MDKLTLNFYRFPLAKHLNPLQRNNLKMKIYSIKNVVLVRFYPSAVQVFYKDNVDKSAVYAAMGYNVAPTVSKIPAQKNISEELNAYKRDAIISLVGFVGLQALKKFAPQAYISLKIARSLFVLGIARNVIRNGIEGLIKNGQPNADTLTSTAVIASVLAGKPESSLSLMTLSNVAEMLTIYAAERARKHISSLLKLDQQFVWRVADDGHEEKMPIEQIKVNDVIAVHTGEKICVDGIVISGNAAIDQASITGESNPAMKGEHDVVYAGSVVQGGQLTVLVQKVGDDTSLARIVHLVEDAQTRRAPVQNFADRMANMLVPISFIGAAIVYGATRDWQRVLNLLFIDFSCGLKLSTATAISAAVATAAKQGILIKGGNYIEALADIDTVVMDKTGTITIGMPKISAVYTVEGVCEKELILLAASAEIHSVHPLAVAILNYVEEKGWQVPDHIDSDTVVAHGMEANVADFENFKGGNIIVGSRHFMTDRNVSGLDNFEDKNIPAGYNILYAARDNKLMGVIVINDPIRPQMKKTFNQMRRHGIDEIVMLTGDSKDVAATVAQKMGIDSYFAEILPEDKANIVNYLQRNGHVLMVGDGINDAPALAFADVGVALGGRRTDIAVESSDITINSDNPTKLMDALVLGQNTMRLIRQNFTATITINSAAMLLGALGKINPLVAAIIHNTATLAVVLNSARILMAKQKFLK